MKRQTEHKADSGKSQADEMQGNQQGSHASDKGRANSGAEPSEGQPRAGKRS